MPEFQWHDAASWGVDGKGWDDTPWLYARLPVRAKGVVPDPVWDLSLMSAGLSVRFRTDATSIAARWTLTRSQLALPHAPASFCSGVDLYGRDHRGIWRWVAASMPATFPHVEAVLISGLDGTQREYTLYLPMFNGVERLEIGVPEGASFRGLAPKKERPIVYYGTSIVHGACASRPGMAHAAILGRRLGVPVINLGFSGNARMEPELARLIGEIDARIFVVDCLPNMGDAELVRERAEPFVRILREARPDAPIVLVEDRTFANAYWQERVQRAHQARREALKDAYRRLVEAGYERLAYVPGNCLLGADGEDTVDGSHPTDLGFVRLADALEPVLRSLL